MLFQVAPNGKELHIHIDFRRGSLSFNDKGKVRMVEVPYARPESGFSLLFEGPLLYSIL